MAIKIDAEKAVRDLDLLWRQVVDEEEMVILSRPGCEDIALLAAHELASLRETAYLLSSPKNGIRLLSALQEAREGRGGAYTIEQLRSLLGLGFHYK